MFQESFIVYNQKQNSRDLCQIDSTFLFLVSFKFFYGLMVKLTMEIQKYFEPIVVIYSLLCLNTEGITIK